MPTYTLLEKQKLQNEIAALQAEEVTAKKAAADAQKDWDTNYGQGKSLVDVKADIEAATQSQISLIQNQFCLPIKNASDALTAAQTDLENAQKTYMCISMRIGQITTQLANG